jgi:hypothetical protein
MCYHVFVLRETKLFSIQNCYLKQKSNRNFGIFRFRDLVTFRYKLASPVS